MKKIQINGIVMKTLEKVAASIMVSLLCIFPAFSQDVYQLADNSEFVVAGTSTIHDWTMVSGEGTGKAGIVIENGSLKKINSLSLIIPSKSLKSGKGSMDKNAYEALNAAKHSNILFELIRVKEITGKNIKVEGTLTVAGTSKTIEMVVDYKIKSNSILFTGNQAISFSEFNLSAPTAVLGTIKTGDKLKISFQADFNQQSYLQ